MQFQLPTPDINDPLESYVIKSFRRWIAVLGLDHWDIRLLWGEEAKEALGDGSLGQIVNNVSHHYESARIAFDSERVFQWSDRDVDVAVVHELLHCIFRDADFILRQLEGLLHRDVEAVIHESHVHAVEGAIDKLAYRLVEALS